MAKYEVIAVNSDGMEIISCKVDGLTALLQKMETVFEAGEAVYIDRLNDED